MVPGVLFSGPAAVLAVSRPFCKLASMRRFFPLLLIALSPVLSPAAELRLNFADFTVDEKPSGFDSRLAGEGKPGDWRIIMDEVPPLLAPLTDQAPVVTKRAVLAQLAADPTDERFPLLVYQGETFGDFKLSVRFKIISGKEEQMAGVAFRFQDEKNFYVIRASALGRNVRFYKVVNGVRSQPIGPTVEVTPGTWHTLVIQCEGTVIRAALNGQDVLPPLNDSSFSVGRIAFWTKSDSVSYFADPQISYTPRIPLAQKIVSDMMAKYPRILALRVYTTDAATGEPRIIGSKDEKELGELGGKYEKETLASGKIYSSRSKSHAAIVMPLRDRNGEVAAAVRVHLTTFPGQTEQNALTRATPIVKEMQVRVQSASELVP